MTVEDLKDTGRPYFCHISVQMDYKSHTVSEKGNHST